MKTDSNLWKNLLLLTMAAIFADTAFAEPSTGANYYCDPATGDMANDGSSESPWSTLEAVFSAGKTFNGDDVIYLREGYHGFPTITGDPTGEGQVTIQPQDGHSPIMKRVRFENASNFTLKGLEVSPEADGSYDQGSIVHVVDGCSEIIIEGCSVFSTRDSSGWTVDDWLAKAAHGIACEGVDSRVTECHVYNIDNGIELYFGGLNSVASHNTIESFSGDAMRVLSDYQVLEYNQIWNSYVVDSNHDDGIQSWSNGFNNPGSGTITGVVLRGNLILQYTEAGIEHPLINKGLFQGIGLFGGFYKDWVIENNIISIDHWNGLAVYGAINCKVINNTVIPNPLSASSNGPPWIHVRDHKTRGPAEGNIIRNNLTTRINRANTTGADVGVFENNTIVTDPGVHFVDYENFDFHLKPDSPAVNAGSAEDAPAIDFEGDQRDAVPDVGADEYIPPENEVTGLFSGAAAFDEGWYRIGWIGSGWFNAGNFPWIVHLQHGWWWCGNATSEAYWVYDMEMGWLYLDPDFPNFYFSQNLAVWLYHSPESGLYANGRYFYDFVSKEWINS